MLKEQKDESARIFNEASSMREKNWKQLECPSSVGLIK